MPRKNTSPRGGREPETTYLVTGGAGFIGSHLAEFLVGRGRRVIVLDDLSTGRRENLATLTECGHFELVVGSVCEQALVRPLVARADVIFHLAAAVGVRVILEQPLASLKTNIEGTLVVLEEAARHACPVVLTSSSEVYGKNENIPFAEENDIVLGSTTIRRWGYACSKALDEFLAFAYHGDRGLPVTAARLFNTIGPRQTGRYGMVVPRFIDQALAGEPLTVYGDGMQTRCFTYVSDVVEALYRLSLEPAAAGRVLNIGTREETTILELARKVRRLCRSKSRIQHIPLDKAYARGFEDMRRRVPDLARIEALIGYRPRVTLDEALEKIIVSR